MWVARDAFDALVTGATHSAFRLETREQYNEPGETTPFRRFLAGRPDDLAWHRPWLEFVARSPARYRRVRVVSRPFSDYTRFGMVLAARNIAAGEDIRYLDRATTPAADLPDRDFWLIDSGVVAVLLFDQGNVLTGAEVTSDPDVVDQHIRWADAAWQAAQTMARFTT
jgi:hypothetical protein